MSCCECIIESLLNKPFSQLKLEEKALIIKNGRPTPDLPNLTCQVATKNKSFNRHFQVTNYSEKSWLCGCPGINKIFCWPCLLFAGTNERGVWTTGYNDLNHLTTAMAKHQITQVHINNSIALKTFGNIRVDLLLDEQKRNSVSRHNDQVSENRHVLERLVDSVCFLGAQELAFRGNNETESSDNRGNYIELLNLIAKYDSKLERHLSSAQCFKGTSNHIQNDLINSIASVILNNFDKEITSAPFVSVMLDETTDVKKKSQLSIVFRYVDCKGLAR